MVMLPCVQGLQAAAQCPVESQLWLLATHSCSICGGKLPPAGGTDVTPLPQAPCALILNLCHV